MTTMKTMKHHPFLSPLNSTFLDLPSPSSISVLWNFGSLLGLTLVSQIITGLLLSFHYTPHTFMAFNSLVSMIHNYPYMWMMNFMHSNGASMFFILIYAHITRNIYYCTFKNTYTWLSGVIILFSLMMTAFMGYILPWGQMSYWGTTVITNLLSPIPYVGPNLVIWIWGGYSIESPTLKRFFSLHFILPFLMAAFIIIHLISLHQTGSSNPSGLPNNLDKTQFHPFFSVKDIFSFFIMLIPLLFLILVYPTLFLDPENFIPANSMVTPIHIQPEWYFLFAYAILRSIPSKLGGVIALLASILILLLPPIINKKMLMTLKFSPYSKVMFMMFLNSFIILTWIGANPVEDPYIMVGQITSTIYFLSFTLMFF